MPVYNSALVFGAAGAIGKTTIECLQSRELKHILATYHHEPPVQVSEYKNVQWIPFEANDPQSTQGIKSSLKQLNVRLRAVIFCIGIPSSKRSIAETPQNEWFELYTTNCISFINAYSALKEFIRNGKASVVVLSSDTTHRIGAGNGPYTASKIALEATALTLAKEEAKYGVRVNILAPSLVDSPLADHILSLKGITDRDKYTETLPWGRTITPFEVAESAVSLALDKNWEYVTGQIFRLAARI